jgi:DNA-binding winged helix-turn-helix (wHTH) protein
MPRQAAHFYEFGPFRLDTDERLLLRDGRPLALTPKAYETLLLLVEHSGRTLTKDELMRAIWPDTFVEEANLAHNISLLRKALGESPGEQHYIQTVPRRGYRFVAEVRRPQEESAEGAGPQALSLPAQEDEAPP